MTIKQLGGVFGRNPTFNDVEIDGTLSVNNISEKTSANGIDLDGVTLKDGNVVLANGKGIDFSATAGTGTSELFDDYEEGTWTPTISSGATSITYGTQDGHYTKIGQMVFFRLNLTTSAATADANQFQISGLPFTATTSAAGSFAYTNSALINSTTNNMPLAYITGSVINLFTTTGGNFNGTSATNMAALNIYISGCYIN